MGRVRTSVLIVVGCTGMSLPAQATPTARLVYVRGEGAGTCVDEDGLKIAVARRLGYDPFRPLADNTLSVAVRKQGARFVARLVLIDHDGRERGQRDLTSKSDDCADLTDTLALTVSIALDPLSLTRPSPSPEPVATPEPASPPAPAAPEPAAAPEPSHAAPAGPAASASAARSRIRFSLGLGAHAVVGTGPAPSFGPSAFAAVGKSAFELELAGRFDAPASKDIAGGGSVSTSLLGLSLAPCFRASYFGLCAVGTVASLHTASEDVTSPRSERSAWFSVGARAVATIPLAGGLGLRVFTEASFSLLPYELRVGGKVVHSSSPVSGLLGVGPSFTFD